MVMYSVIVAKPAKSVVLLANPLLTIALSVNLRVVTITSLLLLLTAALSSAPTDTTEIHQITLATHVFTTL
jgi:hypothetical protein